MKSTHLHCILFQVLKVLLVKNYNIQLPVFLFIDGFASAYTLANIIFDKFLEVLSTLSEKIFLS